MSAVRDNHTRHTTGHTQPEPDDANNTDYSGTPTVIIRPQDVRLPDVLKHIEAGKIVLIMPDNGCD